MNITVIFPHPDDAALNAGGTLARWADEGHSITAICCTSGNVGTLRTDQSAEEFGKIRARELMSANEVLGIQHTEFLDFPDGCVLDPQALRKELFRCVRQYKPERVLTMDPWVRYEVHRDHIVTGQMASEASAFACFPLLYPEQLKAGFEPHNASEVWYMGLLGKDPNTFVSINEYIKTKVQAVLKFEASMAIIDQIMCDKNPSHHIPHVRESAEERALNWTREHARNFGKLAELSEAEAFVVQTCAPGHFDNISELNARIWGQPPGKPKVYP